jgi:hypothetical protein
VASISYLWHHRAKFPLGSKSHLRAWAKRILLLPELYKRGRKRNCWNRRGAVIDPMAEIGDALAEGKLTYLKIGRDTFLGRIKIALHERVEIGDRVCINDGVQILTGSHDVQDPHWKHIKAGIRIGNYVWIGTGAIILPGVEIGTGGLWSRFRLSLVTPRGLFPKRGAESFSITPASF